MKKILICDRFDMEAQAFLESKFQVVKNFSPQKMNEEDLKNVEAILIRSQTSIHKDLLLRIPQLQLIVTYTSGFDHIDLIYCKEKKITVMHTPWAHVDSVVELTMAFLLMSSRNLTLQQKSLKAGLWRRPEGLGSTLKNKVLGIVGLGRIGSRVAFMGKSFGMKLLAFDPFLSDEKFKEFFCERVSLGEILKMSDFLTLHVPYTRDTHHLINALRLQDINPNLCLINTSRGKVVCEEDLVEALKSNKIKSIAFDVFENEPLNRNSPLLQWKEKLILTPHIGAFTYEAYMHASWEAAYKCFDFFETGKISDSLPPEEDWYKSSFFSSKEH